MSNDVDVSILYPGEINSAISFLKEYEYSCVSLMSRLINIRNSISSKNQTVYVLRRVNRNTGDKNIFGIFLITDSGIVLHHVLPICSIDKAVTSIIRKTNLFSLAGTVESSHLFEPLLKRKPKTIYNYHLMIHDKSTAILQAISKDFSIVKCTISDAEKLYALQRSYQYEEVLPPGKTISEKMCRNIICDRLHDHVVLGVKEVSTGSFVAMAGTNAFGLNTVQFGGIYTNPDYRCKGFAQRLTKELINLIDKKAVLFVRKENTPAIKAYSKAGFSIIDSYRICYM